MENIFICTKIEKPYNCFAFSIKKLRGKDKIHIFAECPTDEQAKEVKKELARQKKILNLPNLKSINRDASIIIYHIRLLRLDGVRIIEKYAY